MLLAQGIKPVDDKEGSSSGLESEQTTTLAPTIVCYNCKEPNKADSRICSNPNCRMILSFEAQVERMQEAQQSKREIEEMKKRLESIEANYNRTFKQFISFGMLDPFIDNNNNNSDNSSNNKNQIWNEIIQERKRELQEAERKRIKKDIERTPEWALPYLEFKEEEVKAKPKSN